MVEIYFTKKEWLLNQYIYRFMDRSRFIKTSISIANRATWSPSKENEFIIFQKLEMHYFMFFSRTLKKHGDLERADKEGEFMAQRLVCTLTVHQYQLFQSLMEIYSNALIASIIKRGSGCLADNRMDAREACRKWLIIKCEIDGVEHHGKLGASCEELVEQEKLYQKKQRVFHFLRKVFLSIVLLLLAAVSCHFLWNAPVETAVDSSAFYPTQTLADLSFEKFETDFTMPTPIAPIIEDNGMVVSPIHEPTSILSDDVNPFDTVETSSILPKDMHPAHSSDESEQQETQAREKDLETQLQQMRGQLALVQDEKDAAHNAQGKQQMLVSVLLATQATRFGQEMAVMRQAMEDQQAALAKLAALLDQERTERAQETMAFLQKIEESKSVASQCQEDHVKALEEIRNSTKTHVASSLPTIASTGDLDRFINHPPSMPDTASIDVFQGAPTCANNVSRASVTAASSLAEHDHLVGQPNVTSVESISPIFKLSIMPATAVENNTATTAAASDFVSLAADTDETHDSPAKSHACPNNDSIVDFAKRAYVQFFVRLEEHSDYLHHQQEVNCRQLRTFESFNGWPTPWYCRTPQAPRPRYFTAISIQCSLKSFYVPI